MVKNINKLTKIKNNNNNKNIKIKPKIKIINKKLN